MRKDENQLAHESVLELLRRTEGSGKDPLAVVLGQRGGLKGGRARVAKMTPEELSASGRRAARARWSKRTPQE
jgi:hypothetical protein